VTKVISDHGTPKSAMTIVVMPPLI